MVTTKRALYTQLKIVIVTTNISNNKKHTINGNKMYINIIQIKMTLNDSILEYSSYS